MPEDTPPHLQLRRRKMRCINFIGAQQNFLIRLKEKITLLLLFG